MLVPMSEKPALAPRVWQVGALCRAVADELNARFNPVAVRGEISGFSRAASGHCYFSLKDSDGQIRCAMFRRAAGLLDFVPRDGDMVEVMGRLGVYEARGDLQLIVESLTRAGQGALFEQFLRLKSRLEGEGLFDPGRKRELPLMPRGIGLVTSLGAAALHDVVTALRRRVPHIPVVLAPAAVQGAQAPAELVRSLKALYGLADAGKLDVILLVRGGGSMEDLWSFNDEQLARTLVDSPVPVICGVGHETDFTIADFVDEVHDTHHPLGPSLYYEQQKPAAKRRSKEFLAQRVPKYLGYFERILQPALFCDLPDFCQPGEFGPLFSGTAQFAHRKTFDQHAEVIQFVEFLEIQGRHEPADLGHGFDKAFVLQALQGLTQGRAADLDLLCEFGFGQAVAGHQVKIKYALLDPRIGLIGETAFILADVHHFSHVQARFCMGLPAATLPASTAPAARKFRQPPQSVMSSAPSSAQGSQMNPLTH